jgi:hypothetical protein
MGVAQSPLACYSFSPGFADEPIGTKSWVEVCKGQFEKTGVSEAGVCKGQFEESSCCRAGGLGVGPHAGAETSCSVWLFLYQQHMKPSQL